jgi:DNA-directed RNA polymerase subunit RPC12/RpoP
MSEFKFACPVCGQHITADSDSSGGKIECPTCYQEIVVPQAPGSDSHKFILSAAQVARPREIPTAPVPEPGSPKTSPVRPLPAAVFLVVLLVFAVGAIWFGFRDRIFKSGHEETLTPVVVPETIEVKAASEPAQPVVTNITWSLEITNAIFPEVVAAGSIHGSNFVCERATLYGGSLTLRQGNSWPPDAGVTIQFFARQGEDLGGKSVEIASDQKPPLPRVVLRWKDDESKPMTKAFSGGYVLKVTFGEVANGRLSGRIYLAMPDDSKSVVAGKFDAEIRRLPQRRPYYPKAPPPRK